MKKISIITINYNNAEGLLSTAKSIVSLEDFDNVEWIVIDGGSTDGSIEIIHNYADYISYWLSEKDEGIYHAMNKGIRAAHGEYVLFRNSGDLMSDNEVVKKFLEHPSYGVYDYCSGITEVMSNGKKLHDFYPPSDLTIEAFYRWAMPHASTFIKLLRFKDDLYNQNMKIAADTVFCFNDIIIKNASYSPLDFRICKFDTSGISSKPENVKLCLQERDSGFQNVLPTKLYNNIHYMFCNVTSAERRLIRYTWSRTWEFKVLCYVSSLLSLPRRIINRLRHVKD